MSTNRTEKRKRRHTPALPTSRRAALTVVSDASGVVFTDRLDIVGTNPLGQALLAPMLDDDRPNPARFLFLDEETSSAFYPERDRIADRHSPHRLCAAAARDPHDRALQRLTRELSTHSLPSGGAGPGSAPAPAIRRARESTTLRSGIWN